MGGKLSEPAIWHRGVPEPALENELIAVGLHHGRHGVQLIQKKNARAVCWKKFRRRPFGAAVAARGGAAVHWHRSLVFDPIPALDMLFLALLKGRRIRGDTNSQWHNFCVPRFHGMFV